MSNNSSQGPKISVVMPSFNQAAYLEEAICSVIRQAPYVHEFIVLDGGSDDGSVEIIKKYEADLTYWVSQPDGGQSAAIKAGFERATGDVLCWLNSDDAFMPGALRRVSEEFSRDPSIEVVSGYLVYIDAQSHVTECARVPADARVFHRYGIILINQASTFFGRSLYDRVGGLDSSFHCGMDADLWGRFLLAGARWRQIDVPLACFRKHEEAKGGGGKWLERYREEGRILRARYPELYGTPRRERIGRTLYRISQLVSGRHVRAILETRKLRGTPVEALWGKAELKASQ